MTAFYCVLFGSAPGFCKKKLKRGANLQGIPRNDEEIPQGNWKVVELYFTTKSAIVTTTSLKVNINGFVSAVGGGLGLFLGFSLLSTLTTMQNFIMKKFQ